MTKQEAAIVSAYTGFLIGSFADMQTYAEEVLERPIWTHQFGDPEVAAELRVATKDDFCGINITP